MPKLDCIIHCQFLNSTYKQLELQNNFYSLLSFFTGKNILRGMVRLGDSQRCWHTEYLQSLCRWGFLHNAKLPKDLLKPLLYQQSQLCYFSCSRLLPLIYQKMHPSVALAIGSNTIASVQPKNISSFRFIRFICNFYLEQHKQVQYFRRF